MSKSSKLFGGFVKGVFSTASHVAIKMIIPVYIFTSLIGISIAGINLGYTQERVDTIIYYIYAFGFITAGLCFFKASSPKHSIRKPVAEFLLKTVRFLQYISH